MNHDARRLRKLQIGAAVGFLLAVSAFLLTKCLVAPEISFVTQRAEFPWIQYPAPASTLGSMVPLGSVPSAHFQKDFRLRDVPARAELVIQALREFTLHVNGREAAVMGYRPAQPR